ncbi:MAG: hypothetical protein FJ246_10160 [Nitrospira sp.]|nr:hypothetical protein [Nitrospira sp.]
MGDILKGNFKTRKAVTGEQDEDLTNQFEREALKRLGGSISFVSKKKFLYGAERDRDSNSDAS